MDQLKPKRCIYCGVDWSEDLEWRANHIYKGCVGTQEAMPRLPLSSVLTGFTYSTFPLTGGCRDAAGTSGEYLCIVSTRQSPDLFEVLHMRPVVLPHGGFSWEGVNRTIYHPQTSDGYDGADVKVIAWKNVGSGIERLEKPS